MPWIKAWHIFFMVVWFAGLFYLPRLFVYHAACDDAPGNERFKVMERKLFIMTTLGAVGTVIFGVWLLLGYAWEAFRATGWLHTKLALVVTLIGYHAYCWKLMQDFKLDRNRHGHVFYRWLNEFPVLPLLLIVVLVVVKPF